MFRYFTSRRVRNIVLSTLGLVLLVQSLYAQKPEAAVWQWSVTAPAEHPERGGPSRAFLWIPPTCRHIQGVVIAQDNMEERSILESAVFRKTLADLDFAEIWVSPFFSMVFRFDKTAPAVFNGIMKDLATVSGYDELNVAPVLPMGHSAAASWPYYFAAWNPGRTIAGLSISGQWPYFRDPSFAPDIWGDRNIDYVPALESMGEYEAADTWSSEGLRERKAHPHMPLSMVANPGQGHFASSEQKERYLALYVRKAAQYRLPKWTGDTAPVLKPIDPTRTGWLVDRWRLNQPPTAAAAPVGKYAGNPDEAFWFFDQEMAHATERYQAVARGLKPQLVGFEQNGELLPQANTHLQVTPRFESEADGITFHLQARFYDTVPGGSPRLSNWTGLPVGAPLGHAQGAPIRIEKIQGPFEQIAPNTFRLRMERETLPGERFELVFAAKHPGDAQYKPAVQQGHMFVPGANREGADQTIDFAAIPAQKLGVRSLRLHATSSAGLPVSFTVREGPAVVSGDTLTFTAIPPRAKFPVSVSVIAWQYGRAAGDKVKSATPIVRTFEITR